MNDYFENILALKNASQLAEVSTARQSTVKATTFASLDARLEDIEGDIESPTYTNQTSLTGAVNSFPSTLIPNAPMKEMTLYSQTVNSIVTNGNFANGDNWTPNSGSESVSNNIYSVTASGSVNYAHTCQDTNTDVVTNKKIFIRAIIRVPSACTGINIQGGGSNGYTYIAASQANPVANTWYTLTAVYTLVAESTGKIRVVVQNLYADAATANGKVMEVKEVVAIDMGTSASDNPDYNLTADQMNTKYPNFISNGIKSTFGGRETITGKNLFDGKMLRGNIDGSGNFTSSADNLLSNLFAIKPNTTYIYNTAGYTTTNRFLIWYDISKKYISVTSSNTGTSPANAYYVRIQLNHAQVDISTVNAVLQLEQGSTATTYEPYHSQTAYYPDLGYSLPNGIKNEFDLVSGKFVKNVGDIISLNTLTWEEYASAHTTNYWSIKTSSPLNNFSASANAYAVLIQNYNGTAYTAFGSGYQTADVLSYYTYAGTFYIKIPKSEITGTIDNAKAQAWFVSKSTSFAYQLATPVITYYPPQPVFARPNGTVYLENVIQESKAYNNGITITDSTKPILTLDTVTKIGIDGKETSIATSTCTVAGNGLSFTSTALTNGDEVRVTYFYDSSTTTLPSETYTASANLNAAVEQLARATSEQGAMIRELILMQLN